MFHKSSSCQADGCVEVGAFRTSSFCNADGCVSVGQFAKSSFSGTVNCLEAGQWDQVIIVKDSKFDQRGEISPLLTFTLDSWDRFIGRVKDGADFNTVAYELGDVIVWHTEGSDSWLLCRSGEGVELEFNEGEWVAFVEGVNANEFDSVRLNELA